MSAEASQMVPEARQPIPMSAGKYASYLWLGHCIYHPADYRENALSFHEDSSIANADTQRFLRHVAENPEKILIDQLRGIVKSARLEADIKIPITETERSRLKVYLVGEVAVKGLQYAYDTGILTDCPDLAEVRSPLGDYHLIDSVMRYQQSGKLSAQLSSYATMERLLPGYSPTISGK